MVLLKLLERNSISKSQIIRFAGGGRRTIEIVRALVFRIKRVVSDVLWAVIKASKPNLAGPGSCVRLMAAMDICRATARSVLYLP